VTTQNSITTLIGAGFIGRHLLRALLAQGMPVQVLDRNPCPTEFVDKTTWIQGDFHDPVALRQVLEGAQQAYHLVSSTVPGDLHVDIARELHDNVVGSLRVVDACVNAGVGRLIFASSASVYGEQTQFPITEDAPTNPISAHGVHKLAVEKFLLIAQREKGLDVRILRIANPYGPGQSIQGRQGIVAIAIGCLLRNEPLTLRDGGKMVRDFIYVTDLADAMMRCGLRPHLPPILNLGSGQGHSLLEVTNLVQELSGHRLILADAPARMVDIPLSVLDIVRARTAMAFSPSTDLHEGIARTLRYHNVLLAQN
jgi:UDP-glucose 4-epimerase